MVFLGFWAFRVLLGNYCIHFFVVQEVVSWVRARDTQIRLQPVISIIFCPSY